VRPARPGGGAVKSKIFGGRTVKGGTADKGGNDKGGGGRGGDGDGVGNVGGEEKEFQQRYHEGDQDRVYHAHGERGHLDP